MNTSSVTHGTFTLERTYPATPERVFAAWSSAEAKNPWFGEGDDFLSLTREYTLDFRVGGHERLEGLLPSGKAFLYEATYQDVVDGARFIADYEVSIDGRRTSVSLMTVELSEVAGGTRLVLTEQGVFLDGTDSNAQRQMGATDMLDGLRDYLRGRVAV
jgi:uncharacterized protein YndB with AHSA1/START domain